VSRCWTQSVATSITNRTKRGIMSFVSVFIFKKKIFSRRQVLSFATETPNRASNLLVCRWRFFIYAYLHYLLIIYRSCISYICIIMYIYLYVFFFYSVLFFFLSRSRTENMNLLLHCYAYVIIYLLKFGFFFSLKDYIIYVRVAWRRWHEREMKYKEKKPWSTIVLVTR